MARNRREPWNPLLSNYPDSKKVNAVSMYAETLFTRLIAKCDDGANFDADPILIMCKLYAERIRNKKSEVSERKIAAWLEELAFQNLISLYEADGNAYLHLEKCLKFTRKDVKPDVRFPAYQPENAEVDEVPRAEPVTKPKRKRNGNGPTKDTTQQEKKTDTHDAEELFGTFYKAFPRKKGKKLAKKTFLNLNPSTVLFKKIMQLVEAVKTEAAAGKFAGPKEPMQYCKHPSSWLNDAPWDDDEEAQIDDPGKIPEVKGASAAKIKELADAGVFDD